MIFDTDILIWVQRGNLNAANIIDNTDEKFISIQTYMELLQSAQNKKQHKEINTFLNQFGFITLPLNENIGHRALIYVEEYSLTCGMRAGDAIIAATAKENNLKLCSGNQKHFKAIKNLSFKNFKP